MTTPAEFERCLRRPPIHRDGPFALHLCPAETGAEASGWRLGLVIPKRYEASAVARNTIKRRWRDAFRRGRAAWAAEFGAADLVVRLQSPLVPKPKSVKAARKATDAQRGTSTAVVAPTSLPAKRRARQRFDPQSMFAALAERLRRRTPAPRTVS